MTRKSGVGFSEARIGLISTICLIVATGGLGYAQEPTRAKIEGFATYYTKASCQREGTFGIMANGKELQDEAFTAASWDYPLGQMVKVTSVQTGHMVSVRITDHGPSHRLYKQGRIIDLSQAAFQALAPLSIGKVLVRVQRQS